MASLRLRAPVKLMSEQEKPIRYWIGVASRDHVRQGVEGGFCQLGHGKVAPVRRLSPGDWIAYYSPRTEMRGGDPVQAFTAIGEVKAGEAYIAHQAKGFHPFRRNVRWRKRAKEAKIHPLLGRLQFTRGRDNWGMVMRRGAFKISPGDFKVIAGEMGIDL